MLIVTSLLVLVSCLYLLYGLVPLDWKHDMSVSALWAVLCGTVLSCITLMLETLTHPPTCVCVCVCVWCGPMGLHTVIAYQS